MILPETFSIYTSIALLTVVSSAFVVWRFLALRKSLLTLNLVPVFLVTGVRQSGKTSFINALSSRFSALAGRQIQFVELPAIIDGTLDGQIKKVDPSFVIYIFDVSKDSLPIEKQIEDFETVKKIASNVPYILIANKIDCADETKLVALESKFGKVIKLSLKNADSVDLKKEFEDLLALAQSLKPTPVKA
jgi:GTP1/Obg family GTP-binding protein